MRRTLQINLHTTTIILLVVSWLSCNPVWGFPAASRAAPGESMSARRRGGDGLIVGSDFLNVFIGGKVDSAARSRRYPLVRSDIAEPQQNHNRDSEDTFPSRQLNPSAEGQDLQTHNRRSNNYVDPNEKLSGLIKSQDRQNYRFESQDPHNSNKVEHPEYLQRRGVRKFKYVEPVDRLKEDVYSGVTEDAVIRDVMASEARVFGGRTLPRTSSNTPPTVTTSAPTTVAEEFTDNYNLGTGDDYHRLSSEVLEVDGLEESNTDGIHAQKNVGSEGIDVRNDHVSVTGKVSKVSVPPKFSVSSSVHKVTTKENDNLDSKKLETKESSTLNNEVFSSSPNYQGASEIGTSEESQTLSTPDDNAASSTALPTSTESNEYSSEDDSSTTTTLSDTELSTDRIEDWSAKLDDSTSDSTVTADVEEIPDGAQFQKVGIPNDRHQKNAVQVVSVRVSSSVAQAQPSSLPQLKESIAKKNAIFNTIAEEPSKVDDPPEESDASSKPKSDSASLESQDHPPVTAVHRSELVVEESSPTEVTALPYSSYTSFLSSNFQSPSTSYYPTPSEDTSSNPQVVAVGYQSGSITPTITGRRVRYFNHPPSNHNPTIEALRRSSEDSSSSLNGYVKATVEDVSPIRYASHSLSRGQESSIFQTLHKEPVSVAESIQRSIIASQDTDRSDTRSGSSRSQFHQDKNVFAAGDFQGIGERGSYQEQKPRSDGREKKSYPGEEFVEKSYSQPERVWGEPEKVYGEPEKVYGEPEKVYGEPEKVYGEPAKVYSEPAKVYGEPEKVYGEPAKVYGEPAKNYEVDEAVSVMTNGRVHGVQPTHESTRPSMQQTDGTLKMLDSKQQDPNHKFGYVVEGRNFRKYRVEERTSDGFIVGEYGVVSHDDGSLRGVRYTADGTINPRLIYDTLVKFLSL